MPRLTTWTAAAVLILGGLARATECHDAALYPAHLSGVGFPTILSLMERGNDSIETLARCSTADCMLKALRGACPMYCEAGGVLAAVIRDDVSQRRYGWMYPHLLDLSMYCDQALLHANADAWGSVPDYLRYMREASLEIAVQADSPGR